MRIFEEFSFLVQMLSSVFKDLKYFLMFFSIFITTFAVFLSIVLDEEDFTGPYEDTGPFTYFLIAFR